MSDQRRRLAIRGAIFVGLILLLFFFSRYIPRPFSAFAPPGAELDDFEGIYSSSDKLGKFLQTLGPYSPAVFVLLQILQVIAAPFPGSFQRCWRFVTARPSVHLSIISLSISSWVTLSLQIYSAHSLNALSADVRKLFLTTKTAVICFVLFLFPVSERFLCYVLGLSRMSVTPFSWFRLSVSLNLSFTMQATIRNRSITHSISLWSPWRVS
jgi:hypothetical protein